METKIIIPFELKIKGVFGDGFEGTDPYDRSLFPKKSMIKDRLALKNNPYEIGDIVVVKIETINENEIKKDKPDEFYCVVNELTNNGFYTRSYDPNIDKNSRVFFYEARGMITFGKEEHDRFDVGDILKIMIRR